MYEPPIIIDQEFYHTMVTTLDPVILQAVATQTPKRLKALELFAGAGGLALGAHKAGFDHLALIELNKYSAETLNVNSRSVLGLSAEHVLNLDATLVDYTRYAGQVDLLTGGPPCQPFSTGGRNLGDTDPRNMFPLLCDAVAAILPKAVLVENVKGLNRANFKDYLDYILRRLRYPLCRLNEQEKWPDHYERLKELRDTDYRSAERYEVSYQMVDTADFGIPQRRERIIITAFRADLGIKPEPIKPTHSKEALLIDQWITGNYWTRHKIEAYDNLGPTDKRLLKSLEAKGLVSCSTQPWNTVRDAISDLPSPVERGQEPNFPNHVQHPGARVYERHSGSGFDYPAKALKAGTNGTPGGENILCVPTENVLRYFTTREAARLQTFPDNWTFEGTWGACIRQLGNAVPVELARIFTHEIHKHLTSHA